MPTAKPICVTHLIVRLDTGGAEKSLYRLIRATSEDLQHRVICLGPQTSIARDIEALGVQVHCLDYPRRGPLALWDALRLLRRDPPAVLQGWMYLGNVLASLLRPLAARRAALAWNVRSSIERLTDEKAVTRIAVRLGGLCCRLAFTRPQRIIYNSHAGLASHRQFGFARAAATEQSVIHNGLDLNEFKPDEQVRAQIRQRYGIGDALWAGMVGRYHPVKGVNEFVGAAALLSRRDERDWRFVLAGSGMNPDNAELMALLQAHGLDQQRIDLLGEVAAPQAFIPALDLLVVASLREGTPNTLLEAMACGVNTAATDVGDVSRIIDDADRIARPGDMADLAQKMENAVSVDAQALAARLSSGRALVAERYATAQCMSDYIRCYQAMTGQA